MKISDLITKLEEFKQVHGDVTVKARDGSDYYHDYDPDPTFLKSWYDRDEKLKLVEVVEPVCVL